MSTQIVSRFDLTHTRSEGDQKEYRLIKLQNGLECLLVSTFSESSALRRPSSAMNEEHETHLRKLSIQQQQDRRYTQNFEQSRSVRAFSEEKLKRKSDASVDSHNNEKGRRDTRELDDAIEEEEERNEEGDEIGPPSSHSPYLSQFKSSRQSIRESSSKASAGRASTSAPGTRPQSRQPSIAGVVSGEAGRKLSQIFPPPGQISIGTSFFPESPSGANVTAQQQQTQQISPTAASPSLNGLPGSSGIPFSSSTSSRAVGRTSVVMEPPHERPPALRLSRLLSNNSNLLDTSASHSHTANEPNQQDASNTFLIQHQTSFMSPRTHRTSVRSNSMASQRALSLVYPPAPLEADMSAVAMCVGVGSFATPTGLDGLAHFLEHILFMGSERYPKENEFDSLLARSGGTSNAYTDTERTMYHFSVPQPHLRESLRVFSQFFVNPLLLPEASLRELNSIESEFALRQNIDGCRLQEIWRETSRPDTPYSKFTCGNMQTLKENPEKFGIDVNAALRAFYNKYYVSGNMKFVIMSSEQMSNLEMLVSETLKDVRQGPHEDQPFNLHSYGFPWKRYNPFSSTSNNHHSSGGNTTNNAPRTENSHSGLEPGVASGCCFRVPPTHDMHEMQMTWQLPPQANLYKSKPTEYIAHALGHESAGSILAELKARGWATALMAGVSPDDGFTNNTGVTLFNVTISLTSAGLSQWIFVAGLVFEFIGILKRTGPQKWIYDELKEVAAMQYRFHEEPDPRWMCQRLCIHMLPSTQFDKEHLLTGSSLMFEYSPDHIAAVIDRLEPESVRIDLISSRLHQPNTVTGNGLNSSSVSDDFISLTSCERPNRPPILERYTQAPYWVDAIPQPITYSWRAVLNGKSTVGYSGMLGEELFPRSLQLPPKNPFISTDFQLKTIRQYDFNGHYLIGAEVRTKTTTRLDHTGIQNSSSIGNVSLGSSSRHISFGKNSSGTSATTSRKSYVGWDLGIVIAFDTHNESILVRYPAKEGVRKWHKFDFPLPNQANEFTKQAQKQSLSLDQGKTLLKVIIDPGSKRISTAAAGKIGSTHRSYGRNLLVIDSKQQQQIDDDLDTDVVSDLFQKTSSTGIGAALSDLHQSIWNAFPRVPPLDTLPCPTLVSGSDDFFSLWFLHDTTFRTPRVTAYLSFLTPLIVESALNAALADLFAVLVFESLNQESYMAYIVDLDFEIQVTGGLGIQLHFSGFSHKLPDLLKIVLRRTFFFTQWVSSQGIPHAPIQQPSSSSAGAPSSGGKLRKSTAGGGEGTSQVPQQEENEFETFFLCPDQDAPREFDTPIFYARLETLLTDYINAGSRFRSGNQVSSVMFDILCDGMWTPEQKAYAARSITPQMLIEFSNKLFSSTKVEGLFQGNVDEKDATQFFKCVDAVLRVRGSKPIKHGQEPKLRCHVLPVVQERNQPVSGWIHILEAVESPSHSVELFFQIGPDNPEDRVLASTLEQLMREPLYTELRTKQQLGYSVKCGVRSICGTVGFVVEITSDVHGPEILAQDVDEFFVKLRAKIEQMPHEEFVLHLCGMASQFLEKSKNLGEAATRHWNSILAHAFYGRPYVWNSNIVDAGLIKSIATKSKVLDAFNAWLDPLNGKRRRASVFVVGYGYQVERLVKALKRPCVRLVAHPNGITLGGKLGASKHMLGSSGMTTGDHSQQSSRSRRNSVRCSLM